MTNKKTVISRLLDEEAIEKLAQGVSSEGEVDQATADRMAKEIFDKLYDEELKKLLGGL